MKRLFALVLCAILLLAAVGCGQKQTTGEELTTSSDEPIAFSGTEFEPALILNGKKLNVYTQHYSIRENDTGIPLEAFIASIGGYFADSPYNAYQVQCYELNGIRYMIDNNNRIFALAEQYDELVRKLETEPGNHVTHGTLKEINLFPDDEGTLSWGEGSAWVGHRALENALRKSGQDITIDVDYEAYVIRVEMPDAQPQIEIPDDPERPDLRLKAKEWQDCICPVPETFDIWEAMDTQLSATEEALLMWDTEALKNVGLVDLKYAVVAEKELDGKGFLSWYLTSEESSDKAEEYKEKESREIAPGIISIHYEKGSSWVCVAKLRSDGANALILAAESFTADGADDFDSIVKRFVMLNGD